MPPEDDDGVLDAITRYRDLRASIERHLPVEAASLDGRTFDLHARLGDPPAPVGGYVHIDAPGGPRLGQVLELEVAERETGQLTGEGGLHAPVLVRSLAGRGALLSPGGPFVDAPVRSATAAEVAAAMAARGLPIGELATAPGVPATVDPRGFSRHTFLCGQSGSGKTHALGVLLEQLLAHTTLRIVVLDPNGDFVPLARVRAGADPAAAARHAGVAGGIAVRSARREGDERLSLAFTELSDAARAALLRLDPIADRDEYATLVEALHRHRPDDVDALSQAGDDGRRLAQRARNLGLDELGVWSRGQHRSLLRDLDDPAVRCLVVDLGSLPTRTEVAVVAEAVLGELWNRREAREPVLVVIDEAHGVCPAEPEDAVTALTTEHVVRIAAEGRKFGLHLLLSTQRPQKLPENAVSQCDNLVLMRLNSRADAAYLRDLFSFVPGGLLDLPPSFGLGRALVAGKIAPDPLLVGFGARVAEEGGADVPTSWAEEPASG